MQGQEYRFEKTMKFADGGVANIYRPVLTEEEYARRMKALEKAVINMGIEQERVNDVQTNKTAQEVHRQGSFGNSDYNSGLHICT